jgi:hypothetical protein
MKKYNFWYSPTTSLELANTQPSHPKTNDLRVHYNWASSLTTLVAITALHSEYDLTPAGWMVTQAGKAHAASSFCSQRNNVKFH